MPSLRRRKPIKQQPAFKRLQKLAEQPGERNLTWYHAVGRQLESLFPSGDRAYGKNVMENLAEALSRSITPVNLWAARRFFALYDRNDVKALSKPVKDSRFTLTWSHMIHLLSLDDADRPAFEQECIRGEWSCKELLSRIQEHRGQQGKGGRKYQRPSNLEDGLRQLITESRDWQRRFAEVWFRADNPAIDWDDKAASTKEVAELCREAVDVMESMQHSIKQRLPELRSHVRLRKKSRSRSGE